MKANFSLLDYLKWPIHYLFAPLGENTFPKIETKRILNNSTPIIKVSFIGDLMGIGEKRVFVNDDLKFYLNNSDLIIGNLECIISDQVKINLKNQVTSHYSLSSFKNNISTRFAVSLANNHSMDNGVFGLENTIKSLNTLKIDYFGTRHKPFLGINSQFKILAATQWSGKDISSLSSIHKLSVDCIPNNIIPYFHIGDEFFSTLSNEDLDEIIKLTKNNNMPFIGHHSHVIHEPHFYQDRMFFSSLGDFWVSYGSMHIKKGIVLTLEFSDDQLCSLEWRKTKCCCTGDSVLISFL